MAIIFRGRGNDIIQTGPWPDLIYAGRGDDLITSDGGRDRIYAGAGNDTIDAGADGDIVRAGSGDDTVIHSTNGNGVEWDVYYGGRGHDTLRLEITSADWSRPEVQDEIGQFMALIQAANGGPVSFSFETLNLRVKSFEALELFIDGQPYDPGVQVVDLSGSTSDETVTITGSAGSVITGSGNDTITGGTGDDTIQSGAGNDYIYSGAGNDHVEAGAGNDTIVAGLGTGDDYYDGGAGTDTVVYSSTTKGVYVDLNEIDRAATTSPHAQNYATVGDLLLGQPTPIAANTPVGFAEGSETGIDALVGIENVIGGTGDDTIIGSAADNLLDGNTGNDLMSGGAGEDTLRGGAGNDTIDGGADDDTIAGGAGDDIVDGGTGYDTLVLSGNQADYDIQAIGGGDHTITNLVTGEVDTIRQVENLAFADTTLGLWYFVGRIDVYGTAGDDVEFGTDARERFWGLDGDDELHGGRDEDEFIGGRGNDTLDGGGPNDPGNSDDLNFIWDSVQYLREHDEARTNGFTPQGVSVNLATGIATDVYGDTDTLIEIERVFATPLDDLLIGSSGNDNFDDFGGNDTIDGGAGRDGLYYHLTDGYWGAGSTTGITVTFDAVIAGSGTAIDPTGGIDTFTSIEVIRATHYADMLIGGAGEQRFRGYEGNDTIDGGADYDYAIYHDDASYGGTAGISFDLSIKDAQGFATLIDGFGDTDLIRNIEEIDGTGQSDRMWGDAGDNYFWGGFGADNMRGAAGNDTLEGEDGDDTLDGGADNDRLFGGAGNDWITGGTGNDQMTGGADSDSFVFSAGDGDDVIHDFEIGVDHMVLLGGLTITTMVETDLDGDGALDTLITFSSGDQVDLLHINGLMGNPSVLF
ncbi:MAG: hypothetical protein KDE03_00270 [Rhodobacteraceae bacterium]|nr:hypothetical protein [Paracoccaceae bacterium]